MGISPFDPDARPRRLLEANQGRPIGRAISIQPGVGTLVPLLDLNGDDEQGPEVVILNLTAIVAGQSAQAFGSQPALVHAKIDFGTGGASQQAWVTIGRGVQLTLLATGLKVGVQRILDVGAGASNPEISCTCSLSYGTRPSNNGPTPYFEQRALAVAAGGSITVPIPPYSSFLSVVTSSATDFLVAPNDGLIEALDAAGLVVAQFPARVYDRLENLPLPAEASQLRATVPATAVGPQSLRFLFGLVF